MYVQGLNSIRRRKPTALNRMSGNIKFEINTVISDYSFKLGKYFYGSN